MRTSTRRRRRCTAVLEVIGAALSLALLMAAIAHAGCRTAPGADAAASITVVVRPGDTLWAIAQRCSVSGDTIPEKVAAIRAANGLRSASLKPGQTLSIPATGGANHLTVASAPASAREATARETR